MAFISHHWAAPEKTDAVLCLPLSFALVTDKLYQKKESVISSVHTKVKGLAEVREEVTENGEKKVVPTVLDTADYTFSLQVSTGQHPPRIHPCHCHQGPHPPPETQGLRPEKHGPYFKSSVKIPTEKS